MSVFCYFFNLHVLVRVGSPGGRRIDLVKKAMIGMAHCKQKLSFYHEYSIGELRHDAYIPVRSLSCACGALMRG